MRGGGVKIKIESVLSINKGYQAVLQKFMGY